MILRYGSSGQRFILDVALVRNWGGENCPSIAVDFYSIFIPLLEGKVSGVSVQVLLQRLPLLKLETRHLKPNFRNKNDRNTFVRQVTGEFSPSQFPPPGRIQVLLLLVFSGGLFFNQMIKINIQVKNTHIISTRPRQTANYCQRMKWSGDIPGRHPDDKDGRRSTSTPKVSS